MSNTKLTGLDWRILELLQQDGRMTISEMAKHLGRSRSNVAKHLDDLYDSGVLSGIAPRINTEKLGFGINAYVRLQASSSNHKKIINSITSLAEVAECHILAGSDLVLIRLIARNMTHLNEMVEMFTKFGTTQTDIIFATTKNQLQLNARLRERT